MNFRRVVVVLMALSFSGAATLAQDASGTQVAASKPAMTTTEVSGTIVYVAGNDLVLRLDSGEVRHFQLPPEATATTEEGTEVTLKDAKPGMRLTHTLTSTSTPRAVETVRAIKGTVWHVQPPSLLILTLPEGNRIYHVPDGQRFTINGAQATIWDLQKGQEVNATVVATVAETVTPPASKGSAKAAPAPAPATPPVEGALLVEELVVAEAMPGPDLPRTASPVPLLGLLGLLLAGASLGLKLIRP